jgi:AraC-like DNA-binding protein
MNTALQSTTRGRWSTEDVEPRFALSYWVDTICRSFLEIDIECPEGDRFQACLDSAALGPANLYLVRADAQSVRRTPASIARSRAAYMFLMQLREGRQIFSQYGRECVLNPGDCVVVDCTEPYQLDCLGPTRSVVLRFQHDWLASRLPSVEDAAARTFRPGAGWGGALSAAVAGLETHADEELTLPPGTVAEQLASLLALAAGPGTRALRGSDRLYRQLLAALGERCRETDIAPASFAASHQISRRYLHHLFAQAGTTFGSELMRLRLETARRLLGDRRFAALPVMEVAARSGFTEPTHLARRFRQAYGLTPQQFRSQCGGNGSGQ